MDYIEDLFKKFGDIEIIIESNNGTAISVVNAYGIFNIEKYTSIKDFMVINMPDDDFNNIYKPASKNLTNKVLKYFPTAKKVYYNKI